MWRGFGPEGTSLFSTPYLGSIWLGELDGGGSGWRRWWILCSWMHKEREFLFKKESQETEMYWFLEGAGKTTGWSENRAAVADDVRKRSRRRRRKTKKLRQCKEGDEEVEFCMAYLWFAKKSLRWWWKSERTIRQNCDIGEVFKCV